MIETLARKRTNAVALAVLAALVAALFVALQSASAAGCALNPGLTLGFNQSCEIDVSKLHEDATGLAEVVPTGGTAVLTSTDATTETTDADTNIRIIAGTTTGTVTVNVTAPDNTNKPDDDDTDLDVVGEIEVTVAGFGIAKVEVVGDTDNTVSAGAPVTVRATIRSAATAATIRLTVPTTGLSISTGTPTAPTTSQVQEQPVPDSSGTDPLGTVDWTVNTAGAPAGDYVLTFTADNDGDFTDAAGTAEPDKRDTATLTLRIGEPGADLASATLSLGNSAEDLPFTDANEAVAETGSDAADGGEINIVVEVFDANGGKANPGAVSSITVIAPGGKISHGAFGDIAAVAIADGSANSLEIEETDATPDDDTDANQDDVGQKAAFTVTKANGKPGQVTVYAIVIGPSGAARTEDVTLTFSGPAASMSIADASESLLSVNVDADGDEEIDEDTIKLQVTAEDISGNATAPPTGGVSIVITDPDGKRKGSSVIDRTQPTKDGTKYFITLTGKGTKAAPLAAGNWTLTAKSGELEAEAMFAVAGPAANVDVSASQTSSSTIGDVITVTANVTDKDGNTVSDGTSVMFSVSANTGLAKIGTGHDGKATKGGTASVKYAVVGAGSSVVSAEADGATGVVVIISSAGSADAADRGPALGDLSGTTGLVSYSGPDTTASELLSLLAGRATAVWLSNNGSWVLYSNVDGAMVPGSVDFTVTSGDVLYIN